MDLLSTSGSAPSGSLGFVSVAAALIDTSANWVSFDFSSLGLSMDTGTVYGIQASTPSGSRYSFRAAVGPEATYAGGQRFATGDGGATYTGYANWDFSFRTYVDTAEVPLPAGLPLLAGALGLMGWVRRRS